MVQYAKKVTEKYLVSQRDDSEVGFCPLPNAYRPCMLGKKSIFQGFPWFKAGIVLEVPHVAGT